MCHYFFYANRLCWNWARDFSTCESNRCVSRPLSSVACGVWLSWPLQLLLLLCVYLVALQFKWLHARLVLLAVGPVMDKRAATWLHCFICLCSHSYRVIFLYISSWRDRTTTCAPSHFIFGTFKSASAQTAASCLTSLNVNLKPFMTHVFLWWKSFDSSLTILFKKKFHFYDCHFVVYF